MKITARLTLPLALFFMVACAWGQQVHYNYDRGASFQSYRPTNGSRSRALRQRPTSQAVCRVSRAVYPTFAAVFHRSSCWIRTLNGQPMSSLHRGVSARWTRTATSK